jgi:type IV secretory pathway TrbD component
MLSRTVLVDSRTVSLLESALALHRALAVTMRLWYQLKHGLQVWAMFKVSDQFLET